MYSPQFFLKSFETLPVAGRLEVIGRLMGALVRANMVDVQTRPPSSRVRVVSDGSSWQDAARALEVGQMSCPSAVAWRVAELRRGGELAKWVVTADGRLLVVRANGTRESPCGSTVWTDGVNAISQNAMWTPTLDLTSFETTPPADKMTVICKMLDVLHAANGEWLAAGNTAPPLYNSGLYYQEEKLGKDEWQDIPCTLARGNGDCEDLASYRVSELRHGGEAANHTVEHRRSTEVILYHIRVRRQNGDVEDPSCRLGMGGACSDLVPSSKVPNQTAGMVRAQVLRPEDVVLVAF
jgi:hypothetical protein